MPYMPEIIVIGAGLGGLACALKLARDKRSVLLLEKNSHPGGTSYVFRRGPYIFPMGPLSFSFPDKVTSIFNELGVEPPADFARNHYQLLAPGLDIVYSHPLRTIQQDLNKAFPSEVRSIEVAISALERIISSLGMEQDLRRPPLGDLPSADPGQRIGPQSAESGPGNPTLSAREFLKRHISSPALRNFLGSQGTEEPEMSLLYLSRMWKVMSDVGIWFPRCGVHRLADRLQAAFLASGGELRLGSAVQRIVVNKGRAEGVRTSSGEYIPAQWTVSSADYKKTFLEMLGPDDVPADHRQKVLALPYTGSEACVYLGFDPSQVSFSRLQANHVFYRKSLEPKQDASLENFDNRDIEICLWSQNMPDSAPPGKASLVLRTSFPYEVFSAWRTGEKKRAEGYRSYKETLARKLIQTVENLLPGLSRSVEVMEVATPLTYRDWGNRTQGSVAGWSWSSGFSAGLGGKVLLKTPLERLLMCGIYSVAELFWGGVPTALTTGLWAAEQVMA